MNYRSRGGPSSYSTPTRKTSTETSSNNKRQKTTTSALETGSDVIWKTNGPGAKRLVALFRLFLESDGKVGVDPEERNNKKIRDVIYPAFPEFHCYKQNQFSYNYISTASKFDVALEKEGTRKIGTV